MTNTDQKDSIDPVKSECQNAKDKRSIQFLRLSKTALLILSYMGMGMSGSMLNACIPDLRVRLNTTVEGISYAFSFGACGALISTPLAIVGDRFGGYSELILGGCLVMAALSNLLRPLTDKLWVFGVYDFLDDIAWGLLSNVANSLVLLMWGASANSPIHSMHFGYPVGAALGGQIARVFVSQNTTEKNTTTTSSNTWLEQWIIPQQQFRGLPWNPPETFQGHTNSVMSIWPLIPYTEDNTEITEPDFHKDFLDDSRIEFGFLIIACFNLVIGIIFVVLQFNGNKPIKVKVSKKSYRWSEIIQPSKWGGGSSARFAVFIFLFFTLFQIALQGCDKGFKYYLATYAVDSDLGIDNQEAASLTSLYYLLDAVGSISCIFIARYVSIKTMVFVEVHGITLVSVLLIIFGTQDRTALFVLMPLFAMFKGPTWASSYAWPNYYIVMLSTLLGVAKISRNIIDIFMNAFQGYLYTNTVIESIFYTTLAYALVMCLLVYGTYFVTWNRPGRHSPSIGNPVGMDVSSQDNVYGQQSGMVNQEVIVTQL